ncbi:MAG: helix-turn-helix domain-containing protein [Prolixibacteraceae bacterium]
MLLYLSITGISLSLILFYFNARNYKSSIYLSIFFFLISLYGINQYALLYSGSVQLVSLIYTNITFLHYLIGPMLYFYIRSIIRDHSRLTKNDILHFIPSVIFLIAALPYILSPYSHKVEIAKSLIEVPGFLMSYKVTFLSDLLSVPFMYLSRPLSVSLYTLWSIGMFIPYLSKSRASEVFSGQFFMIKWLTALLGFTFLLSTTSFLLIFNTFLRSYHNLFYSVNALLILSAIGLTGLLVSPFLSPSILYGLPRFDTTRSEPEAEPQLEEDRKSREQNFESNYLLLIAEKIRSVICESQPYLETDLNLPKFASYIEVPPHHLAYYFREVKKQTFNDFRNECRINHAKKMIMEGKAESLTLEAIARLSGFTTRNTFFNAFKKIEGIAPGAFVEKVNHRIT